MASQLKVDTLTGVTTAGSIDVTGEGNSTTTNLQQGLNKSWVNFNGTGTISTRDSFNVSGLTDNGTGDYTISFSSSKANINYTIVSGDFFYGIGTDDGETTAKFETNRWNDSFAKVDTGHVRCLTNGDLA